MPPIINQGDNLPADAMPGEIWIEAKCCADPIDGQRWSADNFEECDHRRPHGETTKYVRADLAMNAARTPDTETLSTRDRELTDELLDHGEEVAQRWPAELNEALSDILGRPCFTFIKWAQLYRAAGFNIDTQAEAEQAFFLHRFLGFWFEHGDEWKAAAEADLNAALDRAATPGEAGQ